MILESEVNAILTKQVLSEERGVAAGKYGKVCEEIVDHCNKDASRVFSHDQYANAYFNALFYRLFIPTELNAMCSGVYGDLRGFNADRENFREDIKRTQAGFLLKFLADNFDAAVGQSSIQTLMDTCLAMDIDGISMKDQRTFLVTFKGVVEKTIRHTWKSVGRAASLWYDHKEEAEKEKMEDISI